MPFGKRTKPKRNNKKHIHQTVNLRFSQGLTLAGLALIAASLFIISVTLWPALLLELGYTAKRITSQELQEKPIEPIDKEFGIVVPKIGANSRIVPDVDPFNSAVYQRALTLGVAHAKGTAKPGQGANIFLFSHSSVNFYEASRYNSVFYLLNKLDKKDKVELYYQGIKYEYTVTDTRTVNPNEVQYLRPETRGRETVTLMTCWPPGTTYKRLLVIAERQL